MPFIAVGRENSGLIQLHYEDHGVGPPVVMVAGYLQDGRSWEKQEAALLAGGFRVITYDRRGFGSSSRPSGGYDFGTLAADLAALLGHLGLQGVTLVGYGMGTGEVVRYLAIHGSSRVERAALLAPLPPFLLRTPDNPDGIDRVIFDEFIAEVTADRPAAAKTYLDKCYNIDLLGGTRVSDQAWQNSFYTALRASPAAARDCVRAWTEDFRADLGLVRVPVLVAQGGQDRVFPPEATGNRLPRLIAGARHLVIPDGPHAIIWTHADEVNRALLALLRQQRRASSPGDPG
jgi:non-heme chloroperoxidase